MSRSVVLLVAISACAPASADVDPPSDPPRTLDELLAGKRFVLTGGARRGPAPTRLALTPAPRFDVVLPLELDPTWPGRTLSLAPHFAIASAFERGGDAWEPLCEIRGRARGADAQDVLHYLGTWCTMRTQRGAIDDLVPLLGTRAPRLAAAVRDDVGDYLADDRAFPDALAWLDARHASTTEMLDALATSYAAGERPVEARAALRFVRTRDTAARPDLACRRLQHEAAVVEAADTPALEAALLAQPAGDATCARIAAPARCRVALQRRGNVACGADALAHVLAAETADCGAYLTLHPDSAAAIQLAALRARWPSVAASCAWTAIGELAARRYAIPEARELALAALDNALAASACDATTTAEVARIAAMLVSAGDRSARVDALVHLTPQRCGQS